MAKSHVNGSGKNTIPRLELEAVLDAIKLSKVVKQELGLQTASCLFWTDSTVVIHSLRANVKRFTLFPRNRLQRILSHSRVYDWNFVGTKANPADKLTRGLSAKSLVKDKCWFEGPEFLKFSPDKWPVLPLNLSSSEVSKCFESQKGTTLVTSTVQHSGGVAKTCEDSLPMFLLIANFSSL